MTDIYLQSMPIYYLRIHSPNIRQRRHSQKAVQLNHMALLIRDRIYTQALSRGRAAVLWRRLHGGGQECSWSCSVATLKYGLFPYNP